MAILKVSQMIMDERLDRIEKRVCESLNEEAAPAKVLYNSHMSQLSCDRSLCIQGGLNAVNARVYAVKVGDTPTFFITFP